MAVAEDGQTLLVAGAEPSVTYLSRSRLETRARTPASPASVYALAVSGFGRHEGVRVGLGLGWARLGFDWMARSAGVGVVFFIFSPGNVQGVLQKKQTRLPYQWNPNTGDTGHENK